MDFRVRNIIEMNLFAGAKIVAGEKGINNPVRWVNVMEILDAPDSLQKNEMLVTTGYRMDDEKSHQDLIARLSARGVSGIAIQPGYYIDEIPQYVIDEANRYGLPVLVLPKELTFSHIMHVLLENINRDLSPHTDVDLVALREKLPGQAQQGSTVLLLTQLSYANPTGAAQRSEASVRRLRALLQRRCTRVKMESAGGKTLLYGQMNGDSSYSMLIMEITENLLQLFEQEQINLLAGAALLEGGKELTTGFDEAVQGIERLKKAGARRGICPFDRMALFEMFESVHKSNRAILLADESLHEVIEHDRRKGTDYLHTLRMYLACQGSLVLTSSALYIHRHTLKNRLERIESLCGVTLGDYYARLQLSISLLIYDYFGF